jgi:high-affinity nickel permease
MELSLLTLLGFGFVVGLKHAFDADHVAAVSAIVSQTRSMRFSPVFGAIWGLGHTASLLIAGILLLAFRISIPEKLALSFEFLVGIVLVLLGVDVLRKIMRSRMHIHSHSHGSSSHVHFHSHLSSRLHSHAHRSFVVGMVHGLAGSAALMLLVLATVSSFAEGVAYILVFGLGSVAGMMLVGGILSIPFALSSQVERISSAVRVLAGSASIMMGLLLMYHVGVTQGLIF